MAQVVICEYDLFDINNKRQISELLLEYTKGGG